MKSISPVELQTILTGEPSVPLIDVRTPVEFAEVHVPQARSIPLDELKPGSLKLQKDQPVYLLCRSGQRATKAAGKLAKEGFSQPIVVEGGTLAWIGANLPVTRSARKVIGLERQVRIVAGSLVFIGVAARLVCVSRLLRSIGIRRRGSGIRRCHRFLRHGFIARQTTVEQTHASLTL